MIGLETALKRIDELAALEQDWDSYGAVPIPTVVIEKARDVVRAYPDGIQWIWPEGPGLTIEWAFFNKLELEITLDEDGNVTMHSMLSMRIYQSKEDINDFELGHLYRFGMGEDEGGRNRAKNEKRAAVKAKVTK